MSGNDIFTPPIVVACDNTIIALKYVTEMNMLPEEEERVVEKILDDHFITVTTTSGNTYKLSMKKQIEIFDGKYRVSQDTSSLRAAIYDKWINYIR